MYPRKFLVTVLALCLLGYLFPMTFAVNLQTDLNVKLSSTDDATYTTNLAGASLYNTDVTFQFAELSSGGHEEYSLNLPTGFTYRSANTAGTSCAAFTTLNASNNNYHFSFSGAVGNCLAKTEFTYRIIPSAAVGTQNISLLARNGSSWTNVSQVRINVIANNAILRAVTQDLNNNGSIDGYLLSFATGGINASGLSGITIAGASRLGATASGVNWLVPFTDNVFDTGHLPQIGGIFDGIAISDGSINETDGARPQVLRINSTNIASLTSGQLAHIGTGAFGIDFSERIHPSFMGSFSMKLGASPIGGVFAFNNAGSALTFTPSLPITAGNYTLASVTSPSDWSMNSNAFSYNLQTDNCAVSTGIFNAHTYAIPQINNTLSTSVTSAAVSIIGGSVTYKRLFACTLGVVTTTGSESVSTPSCNSGYKVSGATCVLIPVSGGGGGGGGLLPAPDNCPSWDKSGNLYDGACSIPIASGSDGTTNSGTTDTTPPNGDGTINPNLTGPVAPWIPKISSSNLLSIDTLDNHYFIGLFDARKYLGMRISDKRVMKLVDSYQSKLSVPEEAYFSSVDQDFYVQYNRIVNAYAILFLRVNDVVLGNRSASVKNDGKVSYGIVASGTALAKNFLDRYVTREYLADKDLTIYRSKLIPLQKPLLVLETKILNRLALLRGSDTITTQEYSDATNAYNDFVLSLTMYRMYDKNTLAKERAIKAIKIFSAAYGKR